jgi:hypothetical protein
VCKIKDEKFYFVNHSRGDVKGGNLRGLKRCGRDIVRVTNLLHLPDTKAEPKTNKTIRASVSREELQIEWRIIDLRLFEQTHFRIDPR